MQQEGGVISLIEKGNVKLAHVVKHWEGAGYRNRPYSLIGELRVGRDVVRRMILENPIPRKGILPTADYSHHFLLVWDETPATDSFGVTHELIADELKVAWGNNIFQREPRSSERESFDRIVDLFFPFLATPEQKLQLENTEEVFPFSWRIGDENRILYSFGIMDSNVKIILEAIASLGIIPRGHVPKLAYSVHKILTLLLKSNDYYFTQYINNTLIHYLHTRVIEILIGAERFGAYQQHPMHTIKYQQFNDVALMLLRRLAADQNLDLETGLHEVGMAVEIMSGTLWWHKISDPLSWGDFNQALDNMDDDHVVPRYFHGEKLDGDSLFLINDFPDLLSDLSRSRMSRSKMVFVLDDVGEAVFHFNFIRKLMTKFPALTGDVWVGRHPIENNIWFDEAMRLLKHPLFATLKQYSQQGRLQIYGYNSPLMSPDVRFLTYGEKKTLTEADAVVVFGANFVETVQIKDANTYYCCAPWSPTSAQVAGFDLKFLRGKCYVVHAPRGRLAYHYDYREERFVSIRETREEQKSVIL